MKDQFNGKELPFTLVEIRDRLPMLAKYNGSYCAIHQIIITKTISCKIRYGESPKGYKETFVNLKELEFIY